MNWFTGLSAAHPIPHALLVLALVTAGGLALERSLSRFSSIIGVERFWDVGHSFLGAMVVI